ncbi:hypothetical protein SAMN06264855_10674 [Halorubrum vacuolatum]|uniref:Uncharacterized protein n=2 Tax=Halorubrum vacuolatum TaxID=63740 RepID=A0A238W9E2_HALVU|nr:hypothetical protein SAMN06264855_10674 [Halorubrum vacuolatum]
MSRLNVLSGYIRQVLQEVPVVRTMYRLGLLSWDRLTGRVRDHLVQDVHIASHEHMGDYPVETAVFGNKNPGWLEFELPIQNESEDEMSVSGVDLRFGLNSGGAEIGHVIWNSETGVEKPKYISCRKISPHGVGYLKIHVTPPEYVFRAKRPFNVRVAGTVQLDTSFGEIQVPVASSGRFMEGDFEDLFAEALDDFERRWSRELG